jgi:DNA-3-methyladenine glycosylase II
MLRNASGGQSPGWPLTREDDRGVQMPDGGRFLTEPDAPFRLDLTAWALRRRAHNTIDRFDAGTYRRALLIGNEAVGLSVTQRGSPGAPRLMVALAGTADERTEASARVALDHLLGLTVDLAGFGAMAAADPLLDRLARRMRGLRPPRFPSVFEALVNAVACQQLSLAVGIHLLNRLTAAYGRPVAGAVDGLRAFPDAQDLSTVAPGELRRLGFSRTKAHTVVDLARATIDGTLDGQVLGTLDDAEAVARLTSLRGIGRWSAEYVLLRGLGRLHVFPGDDVGARNKLERFLDIEGRLDYDGVEQLVARWHPFAGLVYFHLLLDSLSEAGLVTSLTRRRAAEG